MHTHGTSPIFTVWIRHNPANVAGIRLMMEILPSIPSVAVFDTSFHSTIPEKAYTYPLPLTYRECNMRKFGFHGTSVQYVCHQATAILKKARGDNEFNMVVCHLGSGASVTAVVGEQVRSFFWGGWCDSCYGRRQSYCHHSSSAHPFTLTCGSSFLRVWTPPWDLPPSLV
jgi:hypothetical protein